ncbi:RNA methyltransferase, RsmD family [Pseudogulbenkiania sp. NH8B]|uniref:16S rRNA (guanine(966)-N(2))-methyltransferase RsmD n=1 Tax=Pseudogulbenkiania sp. (strain NH8B) TaxID=748280 RepID=UPI0002279288|nr:16S rRNA (guanine(966)-N(2))-methyltransferase RsmD [Pseudogulbenkiania sp. NH8B]BAK75184.1 RNA methyltransferase, RsmD family [Pseudogulbenkiania sp. NH8B]
MSQARNQVRIIGGDYRRRQLPFPDAEGLRPTPDRVRETLFNWLGQELDGLNCLDLFAGSGALGFEAASRRARRVVMVEKSRKVADSLKANRQLLTAQSIEVVVMDALHYLKSCRERFDLVFLDPPYRSELLEQILPLLPAVLADDARVYVEAASWPGLDGWQRIKEGRAGLVHYGLLGRDRPGASL